jgi:hypothetical protein
LNCLPNYTFPNHLRSADEIKTAVFNLSLNNHGKSGGYNASMKKTTLLGDLTPAQFLKDYWHKKPCVIRQAIPGFSALLDRDALFELAAREDVESRLITQFKQKWEMQSGPLTALPAVTKKTGPCWCKGSICMKMPQTRCYASSIFCQMPASMI